jgi:hypothetical protein
MFTGGAVMVYFIIAISALINYAFIPKIYNSLNDEIKMRLVCLRVILSFFCGCIIYVKCAITGVFTDLSKIMLCWAYLYAIKGYFVENCKESELNDVIDEWLNIVFAIIATIVIAICLYSIFWG